MEATKITESTRPYENQFMEMMKMCTNEESMAQCMTMMNQFCSEQQDNSACMEMMKQVVAQISEQRTLDSK